MSDDPIFAAIAAHARLVKEKDRLEKIFRAAQLKALKKFGPWVDKTWPGKALITPSYDSWNNADQAVRRAGRKLARTAPSTIAGIAALAAYSARHCPNGEIDEIHADWIPAALAGIARELTRIDRRAA